MSMEIDRSPRSHAGRLVGLLALAALACMSSPAAAQIGFEDEQPFQRHVALEGRLGATFPTGELSDLGATASHALTLNLLYNFTPRWGGYVGWDFHDFGCDGCPDVIGSEGPRAGVQYTLPWRGAALPWVRAGLLLAKLTAIQGGVEVESGSELGMELGTGVDFRLTPRVSVSPGASFVFYSAGLPGDDLFVPYFLLDLGGRYSF
ncbi:MAG TPA: outer membrane beta-barrel protein [Longimicrobiales bacterium]|nr:outer membrane beta-barrel protein [Longimicrobiales bacterium]